MSTHSIVTTKKLLLAFDPDDPQNESNEFIYPDPAGDTFQFRGMDTNLPFTFGRVVYVGEEVTHNDIFARIVDSGRKIPSVKEMIRDLENFIGQMKNLKIGKVIKIETTPSGFKLVEAGISFSAMDKKPLP